MKFRLFYIAIFFVVFLVGVSGANRIRVFAYEPRVTVNDAAAPEISFPEYLDEKSLPLRVLPLQKGESGVNGSISDRLATALRFAAEDVSATNRATREFLANVVSRVDQFAADFPTSDSARAALTSQTINKVRVTTLRASLADLITPQVTVGEVMVPDLSVPEFLTEPFESQDENPSPLRVLPLENGESQPIGQRISLLDRAREAIVRLIAGQRAPISRIGSIGQIGPIGPIGQIGPIETGNIPTTVLPTAVRVPEFVSETSFRAVPPPVAPRPREVVVVERHAISSSGDFAPVAANLSAQIGGIAQALQTLAAQRNADRSELFKMISDTNNIGRLPSVTLSAPTISGTVSGLGDDSIPNDISIASTKDITTTGVFTSSAASGTSTLAANFAAGTTTVSGVIRVNGTGATSTFAANVDVSGNLRIGGTCISCGGVSTIAGWTDSGILVELQTTSDLVAIGTSTPVSGAVVTVEATSTGAIPLALRGYTGQAADFFRILNASGNRLMFVSSTGGIFSSSTLQAATTTIYGNLGVGTTSPTEQFSVAGRLYVGGTGTSTFENNLQVLGQLKIGTSSAYITDTQISGTSNFTISTQGENNHLVLQTLGRIGVVSTTPWGVFSVEHNGANQDMPVFVIADQGTSTPTMVVDWAGKIMAGTSTPRGWFTINDRGGADTFVVGSNTPHFIVKGGGNVGVGTSSPYALFSVGGNAALGTTTLYGSLTLGSASDDPAGPTNGQLYYSTTDGAIRAYTNNTWGPLGGGFTRNSSTGIISLFNASDRLTIGTTSPAGLSLITAEASTTAAIPLTLRGYTAQAANLLQIVNSSGTNLLFVNASGGLFASSTLQVTGNSLLYGSLGVATTSPAATLAVQGNVLISGNVASVAGITATGTITTANLAASASSTIDGLYVRLATTTYATTTDLVVTGRLLANTASSTITNLTTTNATATVLTVTSSVNLSTVSGRVGISTTAPSAKLEVVETASSTTATQLALSNLAGATNTASRLVFNTQDVVTTATTTAAVTGLLTQNYGAGTGDLLFATLRSGLLTEGLRLTGGGLLGVGTSSPATRLAVQGNLLVSGDVTSVANITATGTVTTANLAASASSTIDGLYARLATTTYATTTDLVVTGRLLANTASSTITNLTTTNATATVLTVSSIASTSALIVSNNLGVGTTSPTQQLSVAGRLYVGGTGTSTIENNFGVLGNLSVGNVCINCGGGGGFDGGTTTVTNLIVTNMSTSTFAGGLAVQTNRLVISQVTGAVGVGTTTPTQALAVQGNLLISGNLTSVADLTATGTITQNAFAYTALTAATEKSDVNLNLARTVEFSAGALATQRAVLVQAPTYAFTASSTLTDASTFLITGAPIAGAFNRASSTYALKIDGATSVDGATTLIPTNAYSLYIAPPSGATNNYALIITGGASGFGTTSPSATLAVQGNVLISGNIASVAGITATGTVTTANLAASASSTIDGLYVRNATTTYATTTDLVVTGRLLANTASSTITNLTTTNATATVLTVSSIASTSNLIVSNNLGVGTTTPTQQLSVAGRLYVGGSGTSTIENNLLVQGTLQTGTGSIFLGSNFLNFNQSSTLNFATAATATIPQTRHGFAFATSSTSVTPILAIEGSNFGRVGIGTSTATAKLAIAGGGLAAESLLLANSYASIMTPVIGSSTGYTVFSGGIGTGGADSIGGAYNNALRITHTGNLVNIGSIQGGELALTNGGTFAAKVDYTAGTGPAGNAVGDINGDGYADMAVVNFGAAVGTTVSVFINNGNGTFAGKVDYTTGTGPFVIALGDVNGDGKADMVMTNRAADTASVLMNNGNNTFAAKVDYTTGTLPFGIALGDVNGDGKADIVVANNTSGTASVFLNNGNGTFAAKVDYTTGTNPYLPALGDVNGDGKADIVVANYGAGTGNTASVLLNNGNGTFAARVDYTTGTGPVGIALGDVNGDGRADIVTANDPANTASVLTNNGDGTFAARVDYTTGTGPVGIALGDVNGDGWVDIATANNGSGAGTTASVLLNNGDGTFAAKVDYTTGTGPFGIAFSDVNGDGKKDIVTANNGSNNASVLLNSSSPMLAAKTSSGRVGVGTSTPSGRLTIWGSGTGASNAFIISDSASTTRFLVQDNGFVGIGTTTPGALLSIHGNALISNTLSVANLTATGTVTTANLAASASSTIDGLYARLATTTYATTTDLVVTGRLLANTASSTITNLTTTNATATVLTVSDIASTSRLVVSSNSATSTFTWGIQAKALNITGTNASSTFANGIELSNGCFKVNGSCLSSGSGSGTVNSGTAGQFAVYVSDGTAVSGTSTVFIATNNRVGIGSTTPWAKFSIQGDSNGTSNIFAVGTTSASGATTTLIVDSRGFVGIGGTTSPMTELAVKGSITNTLDSTGPNPTLVGSTSISINPQAIYVSGKYAYVTNLVADTLEVFDISTSSPAQIGSAPAGTNPGSIYVSGRYAYVLSVNTIRVFDISTSTPALTGFATTDANPIDLFVSGRYAYVVNTGSDTLQVFDISTSTPALIGSAITNDAPQAVYISGRYAYVVTDSTTDTLQIFDISTSSPARTGSANTGAGPKSVSVSGRYAYVVNNSANILQVFDVSTTSPALIGSVSTGASSGPYSVSVSGRYAYVHTETSNKLEIFDISSPTAPALVGSAATGNHIGLSPHSIFISGRYAYVANGTDNSFQVFDVSGLETTSAIVHSLEAGNLQVRNDVIAQGQLKVYGGLNVGTGGIYSAGSLSVNATSTFLGITAGGLEIGRGGLCVDSDGSCTASTSGRVSAVSFVTAASDLAENYYSEETLEAGDVVVSLGGTRVGRSAHIGDKRALGVVSTKPGIILGLDNDGVNDNLYPIALTGRVPVKVNLQGGSIEVGDPITVSSESGVGMKATTTSMVVGYALEAFYGATTTGEISPISPIGPIRQILMFAKVGQWNAPAVAESISPISPMGPISPISPIGPIGYVAQALSAVKDWLVSMGVVIEQSLIKVKEIVVDVLTAKKAVIDQLQMKDKFTGEAYCVELVNGDLVRTKGECAAPNTTVNSIPTPDASAPVDAISPIGPISPIGQIGPTEETATTTAETATTTPETQPSPDSSAQGSGSPTEASAGTVSPMEEVGSLATSTPEVVATTTPAAEE